MIERRFSLKESRKKTKIDRFFSLLLIDPMFSVQSIACSILIMIMIRFIQHRLLYGCTWSEWICDRFLYLVFHINSALQSWRRETSFVHAYHSPNQCLNSLLSFIPFFSSDQMLTLLKRKKKMRVKWSILVWSIE